MSAAVVLHRDDQITDPFTGPRVDKYFPQAARYSETLLFLRPVPLPDGTKRHPRKRIVVGEDGALKADKGAFRLKTFSGELVAVEGIHGLHEAVRNRALAGETVLVAGLPTSRADLRRMRRTGETITDRPSRILVADVDGLPNHRALDPIADPVGAAESMRGLVPAALRRAAMSAAFSSSMGLAGGVPPTISMHLRSWADRGMDETLRVSLVRAIDRFVAARLAEAGVEPAGRVDHALARPAQMQSIAAPEMPEGHADPFAGSSRHLLLEGADEFGMDALLEELAPYMDQASTAGSRPRTGKRAGQAGKSSGRLPPVPEAVLSGLAAPDLPKVLPAAVLQALEAAARLPGVSRREGASRVQEVRQAHAARTVLDLVRWARARAAWGEAVPALGPWSRAHGVPEGLRDEFMVVLQSRLGYALQGRGVDGGGFMDALAAVAGCCVSPRWFEEEWLGEGYHRSVTQRMLRSRAGEQVEWEGQARAPLYWHRRDTIIRTLGIHEAEAEALGLASLAPRAVRERMRRRAGGARPAQAVQEVAAALRSKARRLRGRGMSIAAVAAACDRSETWARRATEGVQPVAGGVRRQPTPAEVINPEIRAGVLCRQGSQDESIRTPCVTSKGCLNLCESPSYLPVPGAGTPRSHHSWVSTPDSLDPGTPCAGVRAEPGGCAPGPEQGAPCALSGQDGSSIALEPSGVGESGSQAVAMLPEQPDPSGGLPTGLQASPRAASTLGDAGAWGDFEVLTDVGTHGSAGVEPYDVDTLVDERDSPSQPAAPQAAAFCLPAPGGASGAWDARRPVAQGPGPGFEGWAWRGRHAIRGGQPAWVSGAGVVVRRGPRVVEAAPDWVKAGFAIAHEAAHGPRREALRLLDDRARRDAKATAADQAYRSWLASQGRGEAPVLVPPEPRDWEVPGTGSWLAEGLSRVMRALRRRDWRRELEALRRAEPLLVGAVIASLPTPGEERAAWADGLAREAARAARRTARQGAEAPVVPKLPSSPGAVAPLTQEAARMRPGRGTRLRTTPDATDIRALRAATAAA